MLFLLSTSLSAQALPGYATLDPDHIREVQSVLTAINRYAEDTSQKRPLNFLMLASPGAGKSHFIRCIAGHLGDQKIGAITYNMVGLQRHEDLIPALDAARNLKVEDKLPLIFLDEFDVQPDNYPLLLPLLWDGQLTLGQHDLKLGKVVVVLAGSNPHLPAAMEYARSMKPDPPPVDTSHPKLIDLLSRINGGVLRIPLLADPLHIQERRADKICIAVNLLRQRFGPKLQKVPLALLRFVALTDFRYGVRSIAHLVDLIPYSANTSELTLSMLRVPLRDAESLKTSSLAYHLLSEDQAHGVAKVWRECAQRKELIPISNDAVEFLERHAGAGFEGDFALEILWQEVALPLFSNPASHPKASLKRAKPQR